MKKEKGYVLLDQAYFNRGVDQILTLKGFLSTLFSPLFRKRLRIEDLIHRKGDR